MSNNNARNKWSLISCAIGGAATALAAKIGLEKMANRLKGARDGGGGNGNPRRPSHLLSVPDSPMGSSVNDSDLEELDRFDLDEDYGEANAGSVAPKKPCNFFKRTGRCANGHKCRYSHVFTSCSAEVQRRVLLGRHATRRSTCKRRTVAILHPGTRLVHCH